ncbi:hypothetical protein F5146DRAFT_1069512, partial [Armillaria mellea]
MKPSSLPHFFPSFLQSILFTMFFTYLGLAGPPSGARSRISPTRQRLSPLRAPSPLPERYPQFPAEPKNYRKSLYIAGIKDSNSLAAANFIAGLHFPKSSCFLLRHSASSEFTTHALSPCPWLARGCCGSELYYWKF